MTRTTILLAFTLLAACEGPARAPDSQPDARVEAATLKSPKSLKTDTAPVGEPEEVARAAIASAEHPCGRVTAAVRIPRDGSIKATCSNGESYRVFRIEGMSEPVAMKCSAAARLGVRGC